MTKKEVMDYVTETPQNVNKNILGQKLDAFQKNVSWNDLKDRPFYSETGEGSITASAFIPVHPANFPFFSVGDIVKLRIDGVEYTFVAFEEEGSPSIGDSWDDVFNVTGDLGWQFLFLRVV